MMLILGNVVPSSACCRPALPALARTVRLSTLTVCSPPGQLYPAHRPGLTWRSSAPSWCRPIPSPRRRRKALLDRHSAASRSGDPDKSRAPKISSADFVPRGMPTRIDANQRSHTIELVRVLQSA